MAMGTAALLPMASDAVADEEAKSDGNGEILDAVTNGKLLLNVRYRFEHVDQDGIANDANAHTIRTRLGWETLPYKGLGALVEFENVTPVGPENFNSTTNRRTTYPVVADPDGTEVNRLQLTSTWIPDTPVVVGRQVMVLDNHRFVGHVGWRQNQQTFDAIKLNNTSLDGFNATYGYILQANRIFGEDSPVGTFDSDSHVLNVKYSGFGFGNVTGYAYLIDIDDDAPALTSQTYGLRFAGKQKLNEKWGLLYTAEFAQQSDYADNPGNYDVNYYLIEPGIRYMGLAVKFGYEVLEGDGVNAFQTPFATLHKFQGWADKFLTTPANGVEDLYVSGQYALKNAGYLSGTKLHAVYHDFQANDDSLDHGSELDIAISKEIYDHTTLTLKYAGYNADNLATDTTKFWLSVTFGL